MTNYIPLQALHHSPEAVAWVRRKCGMTITELARACGLPISVISEIEAGTRNAAPATIAKLANVLRCPPAVLEASQIIEVATSAASALDALSRMLRIGDPTYATRHSDFVHIGFLSRSCLHIGVVHVRATDFEQIRARIRGGDAPFPRAKPPPRGKGVGQTPPE